jgi:hypothetical protein
MKNIGLLIILALNISSQKPNEEAKLNLLLDNWHLSAAQANFDSYFNITDESFIFLGTAPGERWDKKQLMNFSKPYFDRGKAWEFKSTERNWAFSRNGKIAWFDEVLDTWMKDCRGSGVFVKRKGEWKLMQYNLTVLIENEKVQEFIELRNK